MLTGGIISIGAAGFGAARIGTAAVFAVTTICFESWRSIAETSSFTWPARDAGALDSAAPPREAPPRFARQTISTGTATLRKSGDVDAAALGAVWGGTAVVFGARVGAAGGFETLGLGVAAAPDAGASKSRGSSKRGASPLAPPPPPAAATSRAGRIISTGTATLRKSCDVSVGAASARAGAARRRFHSEGRRGRRRMLAY